MTDHGPSQCGEPMWIYGGSPAPSRYVFPAAPLSHTVFFVIKGVPMKFFVEVVGGGGVYYLIKNGGGGGVFSAGKKISFFFPYFYFFFILKFCLTWPGEWNKGPRPRFHSLSLLSPQWGPLF